MRFFSFFALACAALQVVSAIPTPSLTNGILARSDLYTLSSRDTQLLEARKDKGKSSVSKKPKPAPGPHITLERGQSTHSAHNHLDALNLHGKKRKAVVDYHVKAVAEHMKTIPGAHSAVIKNLAHSAGSHDPHIHISATIKDVHGNIIGTPRRGNPAIIDPTHHIYTNKENPHDGYKPLPIEYKKAVDKKLIREGKKPGRA